jgi:ATP-dependent DNA helicase RecQ
MSEELQEALRRHFGYGAFRKGQDEVVRAVLSGRPTIAILPTGGGKSLCYQLPALLLEGTTLVVSPLVALMKDQVDALRARGIAAAFVNSSLSEGERQEAQNALRRGEYRLVYVAPERFKSPSFLSAVAGLKVPLLAVDEAHCISAWGHDFRPEYQQLAKARETVRAERVLALTATATPEVRRDIADALELRNPQVFVAGFDRPNLFVEVLRASGDKDKLGRLVALARGGGPGLVYAATRKNVEKIVAALRSSGIDALGYHAGMRDEERSSTQERFLRGETSIVVATNAFGMGIDRADIRFVVHFDTPRSVEAYYQEIGRAGRDGKESYALLLFNFADVMMQRRMIDAGRPSRELVEKAWEAARRLRRGTVDELSRECGVSAAELSGVLKLLESAGHFERARGREGQFVAATPSVPAAELSVDFELLELRVARERQMLDRMVRFSDTRGCRRQNLLRYFGDPDAPRSCTACDACKGARVPAAETVATRARKKVEPQEVAEEGPYDGAVFEKLRALRTELAREGKVPPYVVFHDATLRELARALPKNEREFLAVKGAGPSRWERYGARVVAVTSAAQSATAPAAPAKPGMADAHPGRRAEGPEADTQPADGAGVRERIAVVDRMQRPAAEPSSMAARRSGGGAGSQPTASAAPARFEGADGLEPPPWLEVAAERPPARDDRLWRLCASGATLVQICAELARQPAEVAAQLAEGARGGERLDLERLLGRDRLQAIRAAAQGAGGDVVALRKRLPFPAALAEIRLALL